MGDVFLTAGLAFFLFAATLRPRAELEAPLRVRPGPAQTGLSPALAESAALERPLMLGGPTRGPRRRPSCRSPLESIPDAIPAPPALPRPAPELVERVRQHPYVRLALNSSFAALWTGQLISLFGDRLHQVALAVLVLITTGSALAAGFVFLVGDAPERHLRTVRRHARGPLGAQGGHDRQRPPASGGDPPDPDRGHDQRAARLPARLTVTTISIFFRPARVAILPRIVDQEDLLTANSALWIAEVTADVVGYPLAAVFVAALGTALPLAFWIDAATYVGSAVLLTAVIVPPRVREQRVGAPRNFRGELNDGWRFLRNEQTLFANTIQATIGQITIGGTIALSVVYAERVLDGSSASTSVRSTASSRPASGWAT